MATANISPRSCAKKASVMAPKFIGTELPGLTIVEPEIHRDPRGYFLEVTHQRKYTAAGIGAAFVQANLSVSVRGTLRGLHYQRRKPQGKLVSALRGEIFDVAVDLRPGSSTFGRWMGVRLDGETKRQLYVPEGFAHGFCVLSETAEVFYLCTDYYDPEDEAGILWSDPGIDIDWPKMDFILSEKDKRHPTLDSVSSGKFST